MVSTLTPPSAPLEACQPGDSFLRVATACPEVAIGDISTNVRRIREQYDSAVSQMASLVVFPELSITGYTLGDLIQQAIVLENAQRALLTLAHATKGTETAMIVGLPLAVGNALYNCAAVLSKGTIHGIVPKTELPNYKEFYERRWFQSWTGPNSTVLIGKQAVPCGTDMLFQIGKAVLGIEICEDLFAASPPSIRFAEAGATIIANPSASPEQVGKSNYRRQLVSLQSRRLAVAYVYAGCDASESTTDIVMGGHQIIAESGAILSERKPLSLGQRLTTADIDLEQLAHTRRADTNFKNNVLLTIDCDITAGQSTFIRAVDPHPFIPKGPEASAEFQQILDIQAQGLATRMQHAGTRTLVLGLSGGLDSTLALLVAIAATERLGKRPADVVQTITMPGEASSDHTQDNARSLATALSISNETIPISQLASAQLKALGHNGLDQDVTYENVQARLRTSILFNRANQVAGLVVGTGDMSEIALGWCTYNGDHIAHYNVNASVPKTLVKELVAHCAEQASGDARDILRAILHTPISPELTRSSDNTISQRTEELIGPYELHDFFLYYFVQKGAAPKKIAFLAYHAFGQKYRPSEIQHWLGIFLQRFTQNQWKRSVATDGPKVGAMSLSPRGDWRMPSDMHGVMWSNALK